MINSSFPLAHFGTILRVNKGREAALAVWTMIYTSSVLEREAYSTHESLDQALMAAWTLAWEQGDVLRIEGPHGQTMDGVTIANHPTRPEQHPLI